MRLLFVNQVSNNDFKELVRVHFFHFDVIKQNSPQVRPVIGIHMGFHKMRYKVFDRGVVQDYSAVALVARVW